MQTEKIKVKFFKRWEFKKAIKNPEFKRAVNIVVNGNGPKELLLQKEMKIEYQTAMKYVDMMIDFGIIDDFIRRKPAY